MINKKYLTIIIIGITIILSILAIITAFKLYQIGKQQPSKEKTPEIYQQGGNNCYLEFAVTGEESPSPSPSELQCVEDATFEVVSLGENTTRITASASIGYTDVELRITRTNGQKSCHHDPVVSGIYNWRWTLSIPLEEITLIEFHVYMNCTDLEPDNCCTGGDLCGTWTPSSPSPSPSEEESPSPSPSEKEEASPSPSERSVVLSPSPATLPECWSPCTGDDQCPNTLRCIQTAGTLRCVNPYCPEESDCVCPVSQASITPQQPAEELPTAGTSLPTLILGISGIMLVIVGLLL